MRTERDDQQITNPARRTRAWKFSLLALVACGAVALSLCANGLGQSAPPPPQQAPPVQAATESPKLQVVTRLMQISVICQDHDGNPITGLTKDDFTVIDGGQQQRIAYFAEEATRIPTPVAPAMTPTSASARMFTNRYEEQTGLPTSITVILLDSLNTRVRDMAYAQQQVAKFLLQLQPQDRVALYSLGNRLVLLHDFTNDASDILRAMGDNVNLNQSESRIASSGSVGNVPESFENVMNNAGRQRVADFLTHNRVEDTAAAIQYIANHLAGLPGRKNLVWVSASFPYSIGLDANMGAMGGVERYEFSSEVENLAEVLNTANLAVYPVDARGLIAPPLNVNRSGAAPAGGFGPPRPNTASSSPPQQNFDTMNVIAERTGGRAFYNTNDIKTAIRRAIDDSRDTYVIGYYPSHNDWNGKFREIKVEVKHGGAHLRYRKGYFAIPVSSGQAERVRMMADAVHTTLESTDLGLDVQAEPIDVPGARQVKATVRIDPERMNFTKDGDHFVDNVELIWLYLDNRGQMVDHASSTLKLNVPQATFDKISHEGVNFSETLDLKPEATVVRLVARDNNTGAIGSVNIPIRRVFGRPDSSAPNQ